MSPLFFNLNPIEAFFMITGWLGTFGFGALSYYKYRQAKTFDIKKVISACLSLSKDLKRSNFLPDIIVVPGEKNAIIAHFLNEHLSEKAIVIVGTQVYEGERHVNPPETATIVKTSRSNLIFHNGFPTMTTKRVLILDSVRKSGGTMKLLTGLLGDLGVRDYNIKTMCLIQSLNYNSKSTDYFYLKAKGEIIFPWQKIQVH